MSKKIRILALLLTVIMLVGLTPLSLFATESEAEETVAPVDEESVLEYLASKSTGTPYTMMAYAALLERIDSDAVIITEGAYTGTEGEIATFVQSAAGATTTSLIAPDPNSQKDTFLWKDGEAQLLDSIVSEGTGNAKTDITFTFGPNAKVSNGYAKNGRTLYVSSFTLKCGEAFGGAIARLRVYSKQTVQTCVNGTVTTKTSGALLSSAKNFFTQDSKTGVIKANGVEAGIFSEDVYTTFTMAYDYALDTVYLYVDGVYITSATKMLQAASGTSKSFPVESSDHLNTATTWTSGQDTEDTSDDNYTKVSYTLDRVLVDMHFGGDGVFAGKWLSMDRSRTYFTSPATAFETATDPATFVDRNTTPANGVFKNEKTGFYYYYENGLMQGNKTVSFDGYNLVLDAETGRISNVYHNSDIYSSITASDVTALSGTLATKTDIAMNVGLNNSGNFNSYTFAKDENGDYIPVLENDANVYAAVADGKLYAVTYADGEYAFTLADDAKVEASIDSTTAYAPLKVDGAAVTMSDGTAVLIKVQATSERMTATNIVTRVGSTNMYEFTKKTRKSSYYYYASTTALSLGTTTKHGGDTQNVTGTFGSSTKNAAYVLSFDLMAGDGIDEQTRDFITFGKLRFKTSSDKRDDNHIVALQRNAEDGKYHLVIHGADIGVFSKSAYTNVMIVLTPDFDSDADGTADTYSIEAYSNGVKVVEKQQYIRSYYASEEDDKFPLLLSESTYLDSVGVYFNNNTYVWNNPLMYMGNYQAYAYAQGTAPTLVSGSVIEDENLSYTGYAALEGSTYGIYENNILVKDGLTAAPYATINAYNVVLGENIGLNFYIDAAALADDAGAKAVFTIGDETQTIYLKDAEDAENGKKLTAQLSSIQMATNVQLEIFDGEGNRAVICKGDGMYESFNYSVKEYAEYIAANSSTYGAAAVNVAKAMLIYGAFAERYLAGKTDLNTAGSISTNFERASVQFSEIGSIAKITAVSNMYTTPTLTITNTDYAGVDLTATATDTTMLGEVKLVLNSTLKIRIALNVTEAPEITGGRLYTETDEGGTIKYYVDIEGLTAADYNTVQTVTVNGNTINITVLAALNVVAADTTGAYSTDFKNLAKAMYAYYYYTAVYAGLIA